MKPSRPSITRGLLLVGLVVLHFTLTPSAHAAVTNVAWYRLGETDPGAGSGAAVTNTTGDIVGTRHLTPSGSPTYTAAVSATASNRLGSVRGVQFTGAVNQWLSNPSVSSANNNFGYEAWIRVDNTNTNLRAIINNGFVGNIGWGLIQQNDLVAGFLGTEFTYAVQIPAAGVWVHVAVVTDNGTATIYLNGQDSGALPVTTSSGSSGVGPFTLGGASGLEGFVGALDEVRVFTFAPGQFSTNDLLLNLQRVVTLPATGIIATNSTLNGSVNPVGLPTSAWFEWGTTTNYGNVTPLQSIGSGNNLLNFSTVLLGLTPDTTFHFRAAASNSFGVARGINESFKCPLFTLVTNFPATNYVNSAQWGDYNNDDWLDIMYETRFSLGSKDPRSYFFTNTGVTFTFAFFNSRTRPQWGDYDNDGQLDIGHTPYAADEQTGGLARHTSLGFSNSLLFGEGYYGPLIWGDIDNNGRLDLFVNQSKPFAPRYPKLIMNLGTQFITNTLTFLDENEFAHEVDFGDFDNDGRLDLLLASTVAPYRILIFRNTGSGFTNINADLPDINIRASVAWGDYDNDGRIDFASIGRAAFTNISELANGQVWRNTGSGFTNTGVLLPAIQSGGIAWGDYDNDGRSDLALCGTTDGSYSGRTTQIWRNTGSGFSNINAVLPGALDTPGGNSFGENPLAWGDFDKDGRLDLMIAGQISSDSNAICQIWRNNTPVTNTLPSAPTGLAVTTTNGVLVFSWKAAADAQTPSSALTYNLRVGTTPGGGELVGPMAGSNGFRRLPQMGNAQMCLFRPIVNIPFGTRIYWSVQAVDSAFAGSPFAPEQSFSHASTIAQPDGEQTLGDANADGIVSQSELAAVLASLNGNGVVNQSNLNLILSNYFPNSPFLHITNVAGLGQTNVGFFLESPVAPAFSAEYSTNLSDWIHLGPVYPRFDVTDTNASALPLRYYRLRWP